jgi:hypothetical protein
VLCIQGVFISAYKKRENDMKTAVFRFRNNSIRSPIVCGLAILFILAGCRGYTLYSFSKLEEKALENGTVSVGAVRVMNYDDDDLEASRERLVKALVKMREKLPEDMNLAPQSYGTTLDVKTLKAVIDFFAGAKGEPNQAKGEPHQAKEQDISTHFEKLYGAVYDMIKAQRPRPSEIEIIGLRMATLKFIEAEIEDINLANVYPVDDSNYRRVVVSLDLTAWVSGKASAALVYIDLYPYNADSWCHEAGDILRALKEGNENKQIKGNEYDEPNSIKWADKLKDLKGFRIEDINYLDPPNISKGKLYDPIARCHGWLKDKYLIPRIIQVERMSPCEYSIIAQGEYSETELEVGGKHPAGVSGFMQLMFGGKKEDVTAKVRPLNLAFVAGNLRAGWLFVPSQTDGGKMPRTERRLRMVVDIPKKLRKLGIHIHKTFLDSDLHIIPYVYFANQMRDLELTRAKLTDSDSFYEYYERTEPKQYRLIKTRIRNLLYQSWSEEIVADIPQPMGKK